jgi:hypothetical protein
MWLLKDVSINEARKTWDDGHVVVNLVGWRALKMIVLMMTASLLVIRDLEESYDPKRIEVAELYEADGVR